MDDLVEMTVRPETRDADQSRPVGRDGSCTMKDFSCNMFLERILESKLRMRRKAAYSWKRQGEAWQRNIQAEVELGFFFALEFTVAPLLLVQSSSMPSPCRPFDCQETAREEGPRPGSLLRTGADLRFTRPT